MATVHHGWITIGFQKRYLCRDGTRWAKDAYSGWREIKDVSRDENLCIEHFETITHRRRLRENQEEKDKRGHMITARALSLEPGSVPLERDSWLSFLSLHQQNQQGEARGEPNRSLPREKRHEDNRSCGGKGDSSSSRGEPHRCQVAVIPVAPA